MQNKEKYLQVFFKAKKRNYFISKEFQLNVNKVIERLQSKNESLKLYITRMKSLNNYYNKLYKQTTKVTRKLFGKDVTGCLAMRYELKRNIEQVIAKPIEEITDNETD